MMVMATKATDVLQIDPSLVGTLELEGFEVPYTHFDNAEQVHTSLRVGEIDYMYDRSFPTKGHSAVMPAAIAELQSDGHRVLVAERSERYYVYLA